MAICGWVVASGSDGSKFGIGKVASGSGGSKFCIGKGASGREYREVGVARLTLGIGSRQLAPGRGK